MALQTDNLIKNTEYLKRLIQNLAEDSPLGVYLNENPDCLDVYYDYSMYNMKETISVRCKDFMLQTEINSVARYWGTREVVDYILRPIVGQLNDWVNKSIPLKMTNNWDKYSGEKSPMQIEYGISTPLITPEIRRGLINKIQSVQNISNPIEEPKKKLPYRKLNLD